MVNKNMELPVFDNMPGDTDFPPIFIYNMPRGEIIVNTMLSSNKFPMSEPVPGQLLYPPTVPLFTPIPIVNRIRKSKRKTETENLNTMPFYAHEALGYRTITTTLKPKTFKPETFNRLTEIRRGRKERPFTAYRFADEVKWQPDIKYNEICATHFPAARAPDALWNHRSQADFEPTAVDNEHSETKDRFTIIYEEEIPDKAKPKLSSRYSVAKKYLAFPVFSLGKLLNTQKYKQVHEFEKEGDNATENHQQTNDTDTWFIINSRYRTHQSKPKLNQAYLVDTFNSKQ